MKYKDYKNAYKNITIAIIFCDWYISIDVERFLKCLYKSLFSASAILKNGVEGIKK